MTFAMKRHIVAALFLLVTLALTISSLAAAQMVPQAVKVGQNVMSAQIVKKIAPEYPATAKQAHVQGTVVLQVSIDKSGDVQSLQLVSGHPMLAPAAIDAVKQWKYRPYLLNGEPVTVETNVTVNFTLVGDAPEEWTAGNVSGGIPAAEPAGTASGVIGSTAANGAVPQRVRVSQGAEQKIIVSKVQPEYPGDAKAQRIQGIVELRAIIDREGNVANLQLISGHPLLAPAAIDAVRQWKYRSYLLNGTPVEIETTVTVNFTLAD
jgi:TonB family protein